MAEVRIMDIQLGQAEAAIVSAYGLIFYVPKGTKYLAVDADGLLAAYATKPTRTVNSTWSAYIKKRIGLVRYSGNWEDSLITLP